MDVDTYQVSVVNEAGVEVLGPRQFRGKTRTLKWVAAYLIHADCGVTVRIEKMGA